MIKKKNRGFENSALPMNSEVHELLRLVNFFWHGLYKEVWHY